MAYSGIIERLSVEFASALAPLANSLESKEDLHEFIREIGWDLPKSAASVGVEPTVIFDVLSALEKIQDMEFQTDSDAITSNYLTLALSLARLVEHIGNIHTRISSQLDAAFIAGSNILDELPKRIMDYLIIEHVRLSYEWLFQIFVILGIFELRKVPQDIGSFTSEHTRRIIHYDRIKSLFVEPSKLLEDVYGWGTPNGDLRILIERLFDLFVLLGIPANLEYPVREKISNLWAPVSLPEEAEFEQPELDIPLLINEDISGNRVELGISLFPVPASSPTIGPGLSICPYARGTSQANLPIGDSDKWSLKLAGDLDITKGIGIIARPRQDLKVLADISSTNAVETKGSFIIELRYQALQDEIIHLIELVDSFKLDAKALFLRLGLRMNSNVKPELISEFGFDGGKIQISTSDADSFLKGILPSNGLQMDVDFAIGWSTNRGLYISGGAGSGQSGFEKSVSIGKTVGPLTLDTLYCSFIAVEDAVRVAISIGGSVKLGPLEVSVDKVGVISALESIRPGEAPGILGSKNLKFSFKPPDGLGLAINSDLVTGGGYLYTDVEKGEYTGILSLDIKGIGVTAVGILSTKRPDGREGFSLLIIISAEFQPIQLGFGFRLNGVGGLLGLNRTVAIEILKEGIKNHTLDSVLFPPNPIENAPRIISDIKRVFPDAEGRFIFGPMAKFGWGTPTVIVADIGLALEVPEPIRLILLGKIRAVLPAEQIPLVQLNMDVLGVLDFEKSTVSIDASLYESRLLAYTLSGDMALRAAWGTNPLFILSVGGLNPRFQPPPSFPTLSRLQVSIGVGNNPRLSLEAYLAITSNTVQFGALLELYAEAYGFNVKGHLGFDCLFQISPFQFIADISGGVAFRRGNRTLASVHLKATLSGPRPWRAKGKARISFFFFSASVPFDVEWGDASQVSLPAIDVWSELRKALEDPRNWSAILPPMTSRSVSYRNNTHTDSEDIIVVIDPFGSLVLRQRVAPLNRKLTKFGNSVPLSDSLFSITEVNTGNTKLTRISKEHDLFAPSQFREMSDDEKLSVPEFERMESGISISSGAATTADKNSIKEAEMIYETYVIDLKGKRAVAPQFTIKITSARAVAMAEFAALKKSKWWNAGDEKYFDNDTLSGEHKVPAVTLEEQEEFVIVNKSDMRRRDDVLRLAASGQDSEEEEQQQQQPQTLTKSKAYDMVNLYLSKHPKERGSFEVVPAYEAVQVVQ
jgi:hypothetical protein